MSLSIHVIGCGEALDPDHPNSSVVVSSGETSVLIDCGHSVPRPLVQAFPDPDALDAVIFTHFHPDHCFGFVPMLIEWTDSGRRKPLRIIADAQGRAILEALATAGGTSLETLPFPLLWQSREETTTLGPFAVAFAPTCHSRPCFAVRLEAGTSSFAFSGDGRPTEASCTLYRNVDLLCHECYVLEEAEASPGHAFLDLVLETARLCSVGDLRIYHCRRDQRPLLAARAGERLLKHNDLILLP